MQCLGEHDDCFGVPWSPGGSRDQTAGKEVASVSLHSRGDKHLDA